MSPTRPDFDHFVITRFSVRFDRHQPPAEDEWLLYRLAFFRDAACAALSRQVGSFGFRWLVFFDDRSPAWLREEIELLAEGLFDPVYSGEVFSPSMVSGEVAKRSDADFLITTRLDSDDAVARRFLAAIQDQFEGQSLMYVDFPLGCQMDRSGAIYRYSYPYNAFISLIEKRTEAPPKTVFYNPRHGQSLTIAPVREVITSPMWMQVVHGSNLANDIRGRRISPDVVNKLYDLDLPYRTHVSALTLIREATVQGARLAKMWARRRWLARQWAESTRDRVRGTHTKPIYRGRKPL